MNAQEGFLLAPGIEQEKISFESYSNLIIVPVKVNDVDFNFILDTGATKTIIFNLRGIDSLRIKKGRYIQVNGYGKKKSLKAYHSLGNFIEVGKHILNKDAEVLVLSDTDIDMSPKLDIEVHGLLSVDFLKNFISHIDYQDSYIKVYNHFEDLPNYLRRAEQFDLNLKGNRLFINSYLDNDLVKGDYELLIDTGSGDALWVLNEVGKDVVFKNSFEDYLGFGINGDIYGLRTKVQSLKLFNSTLNNVAVSYPYKEYHSSKKTSFSHDGSLGGELLRRFDVVLDYPNASIIMIPNKSFDEGFYYNMSGIGVQKGDLDLFTTYVGEKFIPNKIGYGNSTSTVTSIDLSPRVQLSYEYVPKIFVDYIREGSPADKAGVMVGDQIIGINSYSQKELTLNKVTELFFKNPYKKLKIRIKRGDKIVKVEIVNIPLVL
ncbi:aspartyl protease family protein [Nonlabens sp.]|uniref:retropepsin-like aspartic protease n=1 Tax=Nonlabens sp. TaxID=1888209 RepID=UPI001BCC32E9|nr:aspartyl protease family protein [Nonlabens sp.]